MAGDVVGVLVKEKAGVEEFIPLSQFNVKPGFALAVEIFNGDKKVNDNESARIAY